MYTIARYLTKEVTITMLSVTLILLFIFMCNNTVRYLGFIANGKYAVWVLIHLILLEIPVTLGLLLPLGLYMGILLAYGRLFVDSEMTVLFACGFGRKQLFVVNMGFAGIIFLISLFFSCWLQPALNLRMHQVLAEAKAGSIIDTIMPGRFRVVNSGDTQHVYYVKKVSRGHKHVEALFSAERKLNNPTAPWQVVVAERGKDVYFPASQSDYFQMSQGAVYKGLPGQQNFQILRFNTYGVRVDQNPMKGFTIDPQLMSIRQLLPAAMKDDAAMSELQWRISVPIAVLLLAFVGLPLSRIRPRQGRYAKFLPAILIFIVYFNLLILARGWLSSGAVPAYLGLWWVHAVMLVFGVLLYRSDGSWRIWQRAGV